MKEKNSIDERDIRGWITPLVASFSDFCHRLVPKGGKGRVDAQMHQNNLDYTSVRTKLIDTIVATCLLADIVAYAIIVVLPELSLNECASAAATAIAYPIVIVFLGWRLLNVMGMAFRIALFDAWFNPPNVPPTVASHPRIIVLGLINFVQLMLIFGTIYALAPEHIIVPDGVCRDWLDPLYFSCIVQTTIGFGDRHPESWLRGVAMVQSLCVFSFVVVFITRAVGTMSPILSIEDKQRKSKENQWPPTLTF